MSNHARMYNYQALLTVQATVVILVPSPPSPPRILLIQGRNGGRVVSLRDLQNVPAAGPVSSGDAASLAAALRGPPGSDSNLAILSALAGVLAEKETPRPITAAEMSTKIRSMGAAGAELASHPVAWLPLPYYRQSRLPKMLATLFEHLSVACVSLGGATVTLVWVGSIAYLQGELVVLGWDVLCRLRCAVVSNVGSLVVLDR